MKTCCCCYVLWLYLAGLEGACVCVYVPGAQLLRGGSVPWLQTLSEQGSSSISMLFLLPTFAAADLLSLCIVKSMEMGNLTISVLNESWKSLVFAQQKGDGQEVQRIRNPLLCWDKRKGIG